MPSVAFTKGNRHLPNPPRLHMRQPPAEPILSFSLCPPDRAARLILILKMLGPLLDRLGERLGVGRVAVVRF